MGGALSCIPLGYTLRGVGSRRDTLKQLSGLRWQKETREHVLYSLVW